MRFIPFQNLEIVDVIDSCIKIWRKVKKVFLCFPETYGAKNCND